MTDDQWDHRPDGSVVVQPVLGFATATLPKAALLRVLYAATEADFNARRATAVQLAMTPALARAIAGTLNQIADALDRQPTDPPAADAGPADGPGKPSDGGEFDYRIGDDPDELRLDYRI